jgi:hypothetical protein
MTPSSANTIQASNIALSSRPGTPAPIHRACSRLPPSREQRLHSCLGGRILTTGPMDNHRIERTGTRVPGWHAPGLRQSRARKAWEAPPLIRALGWHPRHEILVRLWHEKDPDEDQDTHLPPPGSSAHLL